MKNQKKNSKKTEEENLEENRKKIIMDLKIFMMMKKLKK